MYDVSKVCILGHGTGLDCYCSVFFATMEGAKSDQRVSSVKHVKRPMFAECAA